MTFTDSDGMLIRWVKSILPVRLQATSLWHKFVKASEKFSSIEVVVERAIKAFEAVTNIP